MKLLADQSKPIYDKVFFLKIFKLYKSFLLLISDQKEMGIGTVTLGNPPLIEGLKSTAASYKLFGIDDKLINTILAERASLILKAPVLSLIFIKSPIEEEKIAKPLSEFVNEVLTDLLKEKKK
ncbi:MAG: hypothetical protein ACTSR8_17385 [Promethearchaeota archaeon]